MAGLHVPGGFIPQNPVFFSGGFPGKICFVVVCFVQIHQSVDRLYLSPVKSVEPPRFVFTPGLKDCPPKNCVSSGNPLLGAFPPFFSPRCEIKRGPNRFKTPGVGGVPPFSVKSKCGECCSPNTIPGGKFWKFRGKKGQN